MCVYEAEAVLGRKCSYITGHILIILKQTRFLLLTDLETHKLDLTFITLKIYKC